jgi:GDP/UDP-N,N'-diacetylbacillosamine 2-epimerase (hydrolysing)
MTRKICIFTGTRAEYGLLKPLIDELIAEPQIEVQLLISGMHLSPEFGLTHNEIDTSGCTQVEKVEILLSSDSPVGVSKAMGLGMISYAEALERLKPDLLIGLGDRFELFAVAAAAMIAQVPVAHLHGGEATEGLIDEPIRHSVTKMSHLHFASTDVYRKRIIQLGECPDTVFNVGAIGLDNIKRMKLLSKSELEKQLNFQISDKTVLVTFHPVTLEKNTAAKQFGELLRALNSQADLKVVFTKPNADTGGRIIIKMIDEYVEANKEKAIAFVSLGQLKYLSTLKYVSGVVGNSSSGIVEVPSFHIGTVNIGDRQRGRIRATSIIDCLPEYKSISAAIKNLLSKDFRVMAKHTQNPYELKDSFTSTRIKELIVNTSFSNLLKKRFYNISFDL